ncbi:metallophosphoesterase [Arachnia propionica]|uniref:metallophosphoesterase family protein n=1 Tax=Arachnia propionica TaxID=1750 RepID=UPI0030CB8A7E
MRFIATADWQLGMTAHFLDDEARARFHQARLDTVAEIGRIAAQRDAGFVVVGGDVFESNQLDRSILLRAFEALRACPVPVLLVPGNHDPLDASSIYRSRAFEDRCPSHVVVARSSEPFELVPGVEVVAAPWFSKRPEVDLVAAACAGLEPPAEGMTRILVGHGAVVDLNPDRESLATIDDVALAARIREGLIHFAVLGDRHSLTEVAPGIWYPGTPEVTARRETAPGNVLLVEISGASPRVEVIRTGRWSFTVLEEDLSSSVDVNRLIARLQGLPNKECTAVWLKLRGTLSVRESARLDAELTELGPLFARLDTWKRHTDLVVLPDDHDFADLGLTGFASDALQELVGLGAESTTARDALSLLYRFSGELA